MEKKPINDTEAFERALAKAPSAERYVLRLYVTGATARSARAIRNLRAICEEQLPGRYDLEVIDIYKNPEAAGRGQVVVAPTLVKELPLPLRKLIGDLSDKERVLAGLEIVPQSKDEGSGGGG